MGRRGCVGIGFTAGCCAIYGAYLRFSALPPMHDAALVGSNLDEAALQAAGEACTAAASPISDKRGTADYRRKVIAVLCRRAAAIAKSRATGG